MSALHQFKGTQVTVPSAAGLEVLTLDEGAKQCRTDNPDDFPTIEAAIPAAQRFLEEGYGVSIFEQTIALKMDHFPLQDWVILPRGPVRSLTSVEYVDSADVTQTFAASNYYLDDSRQPERITLGFNKNWPTAILRGPGSVIVTYQAGHATNQAEVPANIKTAAKFVVAHLFTNREEIVAEPGVTQVRMILGVEAFMTMEIRR